MDGAGCVKEIGKTMVAKQAAIISVMHINQF
jgi:hypothetical protein